MIATIRTVTPKQVVGWGWHTRSGTVRLKEPRGSHGRSRHFFGDRIQALWAHFHEKTGTDRVHRMSQGRFRSEKDRVEPWIYFQIGEKYYRVTLFPEG